MSESDSPATPDAEDRQNILTAGDHRLVPSELAVPVPRPDVWGERGHLAHAPTRDRHREFLIHGRVRWAWVYALRRTHDALGSHVRFSYGWVNDLGKIETRHVHETHTFEERRKRPGERPVIVSVDAKFDLSDPHTQLLLEHRLEHIFYRALRAGPDDPQDEPPLPPAVAAYAALSTGQMHDIAGVHLPRHALSFLAERAIIVGQGTLHPPIRIRPGLGARWELLRDDPPAPPRLVAFGDRGASKLLLEGEGMAATAQATGSGAYVVRWQEGASPRVYELERSGRSPLVRVRQLEPAQTQPGQSRSEVLLRLPDRSSPGHLQLRGNFSRLALEVLLLAAATAGWLSGAE